MTSIKILGVVLNVGGVISRCAQSLHALKVLRCHGMNDDALKIVYKSVVFAKLRLVSTTRVHGPSSRAEFTARELGL